MHKAILNLEKIRKIKTFLPKLLPERPEVNKLQSGSRFQK